MSGPAAMAALFSFDTSELGGGTFQVGGMMVVTDTGEHVIDFADAQVRSFDVSYGVSTLSLTEEEGHDSVTAYTIDENGYLVRPEGFDSSTDGCTFNFWCGRNDSIGLRTADRDWAAIDELYARYNDVAITYPYGKVVFDLSAIQIYLDNISNVYNTYMPRICFGLMDDPEAYVAEFRTQLQNAGIETVMEELQKQIHAAYGIE